MDLEYIVQKVELEVRAPESGHVWRFEINNLKPLVHIYKNGEYVRTIKHVVTPISSAWLKEITEEL